jgi:charged multivesicular body protein 3
VRQTIKQLAKKGDNKSARILAREVVRSDKQKDKLSVSKARLGSIGTQLSQQLGTYILFFIHHRSFILSPIAMAKVSGSLRKSTEIMKLSNSLIKLPQISQTMREMSMEMTKVGCSVIRPILAELVQAGVMEEMLDDAMDIEEDEEVEMEADQEIDKVLFELTNGKLGQAGTVDTQLPVSTLLLRSEITAQSCIGCSGRRGASREGDGTLQGTAQRFAQWIMQTFLVTFSGTVSRRVISLVDNVD